MVIVVVVVVVVVVLAAAAAVVIVVVVIVVVAVYTLTTHPPLEVPNMPVFQDGTIIGVHMTHQVAHPLLFSHHIQWIGVLGIPYQHRVGEEVGTYGDSRKVETEGVRT